jgi:hypothetical protein
MRALKFLGRTSLLGGAVALTLAGAIAASCTFQPGPPGSKASSTVAAQPGTGPGQSSNPFGAHNGSNGGGGTSGGANSSGTAPSLDGPNCGLQQYGLQNVPPDLLIVLDKSGSMKEKADSMCRNTMAMRCPTKWPEMTSAINMVVGQTQTTIRWGLKMFPDGDNGNQTCGAMGPPDVAVAANTGAAIMAAIAANPPNMGATPTNDAVTTGAAYLTALPDPNPKYILLATDGKPNCAGGDPGTDDAAGAIAAVTNAAKAGIPVFVVGVGDVTTAIDTLNMMAVGGGRPRNDPMTKYYPVTNSADLVSVLTMIGGQIATCTFGLGKAPPDPNNIGVYGDGKKILRDTTHANGWDYGAGMTSVELFGATCDAVKSKMIAQVQAVFGCPGQRIP